MRLFNKENKNKETHRLPMGQKSKRALAVYSALVFLLCCCTTTAFAAGDPLTVINNLSDFIFGLIRAIGMILLGFGVVQIGLSLKSHDPSPVSYTHLDVYKRQRQGCFPTTALTPWSSSTPMKPM